MPLRSSFGDPIRSSAKAVRIQQQFKLLQESVKQATIPDGILSQCKFKCSINDNELQHNIDKLMVFTASRILDLLIIYYGQWKNKLWSLHYKIMNSLQQSVNTSEYGNIMNSVSEHIRKEKGTLNKTHSSKLQRDLNHNKKYLPNDYMVPPLPATTKNIIIPENTNR